MLLLILLVVTSNVLGEIKYFANENLVNTCTRFCGCYEYTMEIFGAPEPDPAKFCLWNCGCDTTQSVSNVELQSYMEMIEIPDSDSIVSGRSDPLDGPGLFKCENLLGDLSCALSPTTCTPDVVKVCRRKCDACHCRQSEYEVEATSYLPWGEFTGKRYCKDGAVGMMPRITDSQGAGDDAALTGMRLICSDGTYTSNPAFPWGSWGGQFLCPSGTYVIGFAHRSEPYHPTDNTGSNNVRLYCGAKNSHKTKPNLKYPREILYQVEGNGGSWGSWGSPQICDHGYVVCSLNVKIVEYSRSPDVDELGMTTFRFGCCCEYR